MVSPEECVERLMADWKEIKEESVSKGKVEEAADDWQGSLNDKNYFQYRERILRLHSGTGFCTIAESLADKLRQGGARVQIKFLELYAKQTSLPAED